LSFVEDLLETDAVRGVHPHGDLGEILADGGIFRDQFELIGIHVVELLLTGVGDVPLILELLATGSEAEKEIAAHLVVLIRGDLIGELLVELEDAFGILVNLGYWLVVFLGDVRGHLEIVAIALVVDGAFLSVFVGNGIGLIRVELEVGGRGVEVGCRGIELGEDGLEVLPGETRSRQRKQKHGGSEQQYVGSKQLFRA